jgi:hypothetical protein
MSEDLRRAAQGKRDMIEAELRGRVQDELAAGRRSHARCCPRCGRPIRAGQAVTRIYGTAVHRRCEGSRH